MNVYEVDIWKSVKHNGIFSHNIQRKLVIHAVNEQKARSKTLRTLASSSTQHSVGTVTNGLTIEVSPEYIYGIQKTGTVIKRMYYEYSDGRNPRPVE